MHCMLGGLVSAALKGCHADRDQHVGGYDPGVFDQIKRILELQTGLHGSAVVKPRLKFSD